MTQYIDRAKALNAICDGCNLEFSDQPCEPCDCKIRESLLNVPVNEMTFFGYKLEELQMFIALCQQHGVTPEKMHKYYENFRTVYGIIANEFDRAIGEAYSNFFEKQEGSARE